MSITFGGLATGLDTDSIVKELMSLERKPLTRLEGDRSWYQAREQAYTKFDGLLKGFLDKIANLGNSDDLRQKAVATSSEENLSVSAGADALPGTSYQVEVLSLAQVQKSVSAGYADKSATNFNLGELTLTVGDNDPVTITIDATNNSLAGIMEAINEADAGVNAAIINDGTDNPYRIVLTGENVATNFSLSSNLTSSSGGYDSLAVSETQAASQAHVRVDNIDIYSDSNTLDEAIPGLTLDLTQAEEGAITNIGVSLDVAAIKSQIQDFVAGYNGVMSFIGSQSASGEESSGGTLVGDPGMNGVKRRLQSLLTTTVSNSGHFAALSQLGLETQKDGTLRLNDETLSEAIQNDLESVEKLLVGEGSTEGIAVQFQNYLEGKTNSIDGLLASNKKSTESTLNRIDDRIERLEMRLEKKEETMRKKFTAMEELISSMNSQSSFLTQQLASLSTMMSSRDK